jgi:hypothetical protein
MYESISSAHNVYLLIFIRGTDENLALNRGCSLAVFCVGPYNRERNCIV